MTSHFFHKRLTFQKSLTAVLMTGVVLAVLLGYSAQAPDARAQETVDELRAKIQTSQSELRKIEEEIRKYEHELTQVGAEKKTLQNAIHELDTARKKIQSEVRATEHKINSTDLEIEELEREIRVKELEIERDMSAISESFRVIDQVENDTMVELLLAYDSIAEVWDALEEQLMVRESLREDMRALDALKNEYERAMGRSFEKREQLGIFKEELSGEQSALDQTRAAKDDLLDQTKNEEANYQNILAEKRAARVKFEKEMAAYESQLKFILDPATIPAAGSGVLRWPVDVAFMAGCADRQASFGNQHCVTQYFGNTSFAQSGAYNGNGHNGIDFGIPTGTKIVAALAGTVLEINEGVAPNCQYGKWVLVKHANGLTTLYAHMSSIAVGQGQSVATGQLLGYSGSTGYATGPHLHFTVYASDAVSFKQYACNSGPVVRVPVSAFSGYLNPIQYL